MQKIKISIVSYYNTLPFLYGIEKNTELTDRIILYKDTPAESARKVLENEVDLGLIPVAVIHLMKNPEIITDYCIGANGKVETVLLLSDVPLEKIDTIFLDYQSRTSVQLVKVLCKMLWNISPEFVKAYESFESDISGTSAGVVIGNRTFNLKNKFKFVYDLSEEWYKLTNMPFVFACWVANKKIDENFIKLFNETCKTGIDNIEQVLYENQQIGKEINLRKYLTQDIDYKFDSNKQNALNLFRSYITELNL